MIFSWIIKKISQFLDHRRYVKKLKQLNIHINTMDTEDLSNILCTIKESYSSFIDTVPQKYFNDNYDQIVTVDHYVEQEASHRRSKRKPSKSVGQKRYYRYRRYY